jgi:septal ring factor EnvC (AmiA/AmiB activator)
MSPRRAKAGWLLAAFFAAAALLFAWQYAQARRDADAVRRDYELLHQRVEEQAKRNEQLDASLRSLSARLTDAQTRIEMLGRTVTPPPAPAAP